MIKISRVVTITEDINPLENLRSLYSKGFRYMAKDGTVYRPMELDRKAYKAWNCIHAGEAPDPEARDLFIERNRNNYIDLGWLISRIERGGVL